MTSESTCGAVYLVGAGPGSPGLLTLRGMECLQRADVVYYDYLVNPQILRHVKAQAERICLGQHGRSKIWPQHEINQAIVERARAGQCVVRLKGGDPAVFARAAEETEALRSADISFEIVPGITSALAAGSFAGIPVTDRQLSSAVALIAGHQQTGASDAALDYEAVARFPGTLVFYMGVTTVQTWTAALLEHGKPADTPVAIVRRCSLPDQIVIRTTLRQVCDELTPSSRLRPPVIVIIGAVAGQDLGISWFEKRPLFGQTILATRPRDQSLDLRSQSGDLERQLAELGANVLEQPAIHIQAPDDWSDVDDCIARIADFDWIVFSSANGVRFLLDRVQTLGKDMRHLGSAQLAVIGPGTAHELTRYHLRADVRPEAFRAEALADVLSPRADGKRFLLVRASRGREVLAEQLRAAGAEVRQTVAYRSQDVERPDPEVLSQLRDGRIDWITVTSSATARSLANLFGDQLKRTRLASISPITTDTLRTIGLEPAAEATSHTMSGVVQAIVKTVQS